MDGMETVSLPIEAVCPLKSFTVTHTAGVTAYDLRPPEGELWFIIDVVGSHDGVAARDVEWNFSDQVDAIPYCHTPALASGVLQRFRQASGLTGPLILSHQTMLTWRIAAIAAGEHLIVRAMYYRLRGIPVFVNV